jgi:prephenate dehydratase
MIGYLGPDQSFTHQALQSMNLGQPTKAYPSIRSLFVALRAKQVESILVPVENSTEGSVTTTMDALMQEDVHINQEWYLPIRLHLFSKANSLQDVTHVLSHPQALAQCRVTLEHLLTNYIDVPTTSTAEALSQLDSLPDAYAALAGEHIKTTTPILKPYVQDAEDNATRFLLLSSSPTNSKEANKTSLLCSPKTDRPGLLYDLLHEFAIRRMNLTKIESRKVKTSTNLFTFFLDVEMNANDPAFTELLELLHYKQFYPRVLGTYPVHKK